MRLIEKILDLILYSNCWIAIAAAAMCLQTQFLLTRRLAFGSLLGFVFSATLFLYAVHRIVGLKKMNTFEERGRYAIISRFHSHMLQSLLEIGPCSLTS